MSSADKSNKSSLNDLANAFGDMNMGPSWARDKADANLTKKKYAKVAEREDRGSRGRRDDRRGNSHSRVAHENGFRGRRDNRKERRPRREPIIAPQHIEAEIMPTEPAVDVLAAQITGSGRTWSVFDQARIILEDRERFSVIFQSSEKEKPLYFCKEDQSLWLTREEAIAHIRKGEWLAKYYKIEEVEAEPPKGDFSAVAKCGFSGVWLGPSNFHGYQEKIREKHRQDFSNMDFERYRSRVETVQGEEAVAEWLQTMAKKTIYRPITPVNEGEEPTDPVDDAPTFENLNQLEEHFLMNHFEAAFDIRPKAWVPSGIEAKFISSGLLASLKDAIATERRYPSKLSAFLCRQFTGRKLAAYKFKGKLKCGPARPKALPTTANFAERPSKILQWVSTNDGKLLEDLWQELCGESANDEDKKLWDVDLQWLLREGYVILLPSLELHIAKKSAKVES